MNRWEIVFSGASVLTLFFLLSTSCIHRGESSSSASNIRQRSDGCGPHPLIALAAASRPFGSNGAGSLNDVLRAVRADPVVWPVMQNLLRRYDDCIRAADGLHYKRSDDSVVSGSSSSSSGAAPPLLYNNAFPLILEGRNSGKGSKSSFASSSYSSAAASDPEDIITVGNDIIPWLPSPI